MKILIAHDHVSASARNDEADTLVQARVVAAALEELGHEWMTLGITLDLDAARTAIERLEPDLIFNLVESLGGFGRLIHVAPGLLDAMNIPYTGAPAEAMLATSNKLVAKRLMRAANLPTAPWFTLNDLRGAKSQRIPAGRYIIKSVWEHASIGLDEDSVVAASSAAHLRAALENRLDQIGGAGFAEAYIDGREFNLALLSGGPSREPQFLPPAEIDFTDYHRDKPRVVGYRAKWDEGSFEYTHTPQRYDFPGEDQPLLDQLESIARECWRLFDLRGYARVDFRVDESSGGGSGGGRPWVLEVNANPCLSPDAGFAAALQRAGIPFASAIDRILHDTSSVHATQSAHPLAPGSAGGW